MTLGPLVDGLRVVRDGLKPRTRSCSTGWPIRWCGRAPRSRRRRARSRRQGRVISRPDAFFPFLHRPADLRVGPVAHHPDRRRHRPVPPARLGISRDRAAHRQRHRDLSRRLGRGDRPDRRHADRAGGQRRRRHALHLVAVDRRRPAVDQRRLQARRRHRPGAGAGAEPRRRRPAAPARGRAAARHRRAQGLARPDDGRAHDLARRQPRPAVHLELRHALREGRADPRRGRRQRAWCSARATTRCASGSTRRGSPRTT